MIFKASVYSTLYNALRFTLAPLPEVTLILKSNWLIFDNQRSVYQGIKFDTAAKEAQTDVTGNTFRMESTKYTNLVLSEKSVSYEVGNGA